MPLRDIAIPNRIRPLDIGVPEMSLTSCRMISSKLYARDLGGREELAPINEKSWVAAQLFVNSRTWMNKEREPLNSGIVPTPAIESNPPLYESSSQSQGRTWAAVPQGKSQGRGKSVPHRSGLKLPYLQGKDPSQGLPTTRTSREKISHLKEISYLEGKESPSPPGCSEETTGKGTLVAPSRPGRRPYFKESGTVPQGKPRTSREIAS